MRLSNAALQPQRSRCPIIHLAYFAQVVVRIYHVRCIELRRGYASTTLPTKNLRKQSLGCISDTLQEAFAPFAFELAQPSQKGSLDILGLCVELHFQLP